DRPEGDAVAVRQAAADEGDSLVRHPLELIQGKPGLPDPRGAEDRHELRPARLDRAAVGGLESADLLATAYERRVEPAGGRLGGGSHLLRDAGGPRLPSAL